MKKIRAAVVGYGNIGHFTVEALEAAPDFEIAGIVRRQGDELTLLGDGNLRQTERTDTGRVVGLLTAVIRKGRTYPTDGAAWLRYSRWWRRLTPVRRWLLAIFRRI